MRKGHRSGSVVCCPAGRCWCLRAAAERCEYKRVYLGLHDARVATDSLLVSQKIAQPKPSVPILLRTPIIGWLHEILIEGDKIPTKRRSKEPESPGERLAAFGAPGLAIAPRSRSSPGRLGENAGAFGADPVPARHKRGIARPFEADGALVCSARTLWRGLGPRRQVASAGRVESATERRVYARLRLGIALRLRCAVPQRRRGFVGHRAPTIY